MNDWILAVFWGAFGAVGALIASARLRAPTAVTGTPSGDGGSAAETTTGSRQPHGSAEVWLSWSFVGLLLATIPILLSAQHPVVSNTPQTQDASPQGGEIAALVGHLQANPRDVDVMGRLAAKLLQAQMFAEATLVIDRALSIDPHHGPVRAHRALLRSTTSGPDAAITELKTLVEERPNLSEGWLYLGMLSMQGGATEAAQQYFARFVDVSPEGPQKQRIRSMLAQMRAAAADSPQNPSADSPEPVRSP